MYSQFTGSCVIVLPVLPKTMSHGYQTWWRVGVADTSQAETVRQACKKMQQEMDHTRAY